MTSFVWANETQREVATVGGGVLRGPIRHKEKWPQLEEEFCVGTAGFDLEDFIHFQFLLHLPAKNFFLLDISDSRSAICACSFSTCFMVAFCFLFVF